MADKKYKLLEEDIFIEENDRHLYVMEAEEVNLDELHHAGFEVIFMRPGITKDDWVHALMENYECEVFDALGANFRFVQESLGVMWEKTRFTPADTSMNYTFKEWSEILADENDARYLELICKIKKQ